MKIAVTYEDGRIFQHFGHTEQFKIYETADGRIVRAEVVDTNGSGHGALAGFSDAAVGVDALICGGIGGGAQAALAEAGHPGCTAAFPETRTKRFWHFLQGLLDTILTYTAAQPRTWSRRTLLRRPWTR